MHVLINGESRLLPAGSSVLDVLVLVGAPQVGVAVAVDGVVVRRADWPGTTLPDGARIEVLTAVQGG